MKKYLKRKEYWEALWIVSLNELLGMPKYTYGWWIARLSLVKKGEI